MAAKIPHVSNNKKPQFALPQAGVFMRTPGSVRLPVNTSSAGVWRDEDNQTKANVGQPPSGHNNEKILGAGDSLNSFAFCAFVGPANAEPFEFLDSSIGPLDSDAVYLIAFPETECHR